MYTRFLFIVLMCVSFITPGQNYLVNFSAYGIVNTIDSVRILNLAQNTSVVLGGNDTLLLTSVVGLQNPQNRDEGIKIRPMPNSGNAYISFRTESVGRVRIIIADAGGKLLANENYYLQTGSHVFEMNHLPSGTHVLKVVTPEHILTAKLIVISSESNPNRVQISLLQNGGQLKKSRSVVVMQYNEGEVLLFKAYSGNHTRVQPWISNTSITLWFDFVQCADLMGNYYPVVKIGAKYWMASNLKNTYFNDGTPIPFITDNTAWANATTPAMCWQYNNPQHMNNGGVYNWYAAETDNICPFGWRVPTLQDFEQLLVFLQQYGYNYNGSIDPDNDPYTNDFTAKSLSSRTFWYVSNVEGAPGNSDFPNSQNKTGFELFPYGGRSYDGGIWLSSTFEATLWSKTENTSTTGRLLQIRYNDPKTTIPPIPKAQGAYVRCIKD